MKHLKSIFFVLIIAIVCIPIALNLICLTTIPLPIIGDGKLWLNFWGSYLGGIIAVMSTMYVLYKNHDREIKRKLYEDKKIFFEKFCEDLGNLCAVINTDQLSYFIMSLKDPKVAIRTITDIGSLEEKIKVAYNVFCMKYAHDGGKEKEDLLNAYYYCMEEILNRVSDIQEAIVDRKLGKIGEEQYNYILSQVCKKLELLGDKPRDLFSLASLWKKKEFYIMEQLRQQYIYD